MIFFLYLAMIIIITNLLNKMRVKFIKQFIFNLIIFHIYNVIVILFFYFKTENVSVNFLIFIFFYFSYAALQKSISIKMVVDVERKDFNFEKYYKIFKTTSYEARIENLIRDKLIIKTGNQFKLSDKALKIRKIFTFIQNIYGIKNSG